MTVPLRAADAVNGIRDVLEDLVERAVLVLVRLGRQVGSRKVPVVPHDDDPLSCLHSP